jgi:hypothetical protein
VSQRKLPKLRDTCGQKRIVARASTLSTSCESTRCVNQSLCFVVTAARVQVVRDDGNCFFRAVGQQLDIDHTELREMTCDYIESHDDVFRPFVEDEDETLEQ